MNDSRQTRFPKTSRGFSLVEVVIALGVASFSLVAVLGVFPVGIQTLRDAIDSSTEGQIVRQMSAKSLLLPFSRIDNELIGKTFFFDEEGAFLTNTPAASPSDARYWLTVTNATTDYPGIGALPAGVSASNGMRALRFEVVVKPSSQAQPGVTNTYVVSVPNSGI